MSPYRLLEERCFEAFKAALIEWHELEWWEEHPEFHTKKIVRLQRNN